MTDSMPDSFPESGQDPTITEEERRIDRYADNGFVSYEGARGAVLGERPELLDKDNTISQPTHRRPSGNVQDFSGRADEFRGGVGVAAPGFEESQARGIPKVIEAARESRLTKHRNSTKTKAVLEALEKVGLAKSATGAVSIFAEDDISDPRRLRLARYRDGDHAQILAEEYAADAANVMERACGSCALRFADCFMQGRPRSFIRHFESPSSRDALRKDIERTAKNGIDFNCSDSVAK